ncbi:GNAT family N-acetyltransferase [Nocardia wallacei]|uniref:GNAT family N-acetyltransferase n=1 Tax=Nocardia wallacei TaxID=480035 RepID=UPI002456B95F|nr:GNAT family N-acetyltransferase [Nocardia wallacei]
MPDTSEALAIETVTNVDEETLTALAGLLPQLSTTAAPLTAELLEEVATSPSTQLLVARLDGDIVGALTLVVYAIPTGLRARIEDVVVDQAARGRGVGKSLTTTALDIAKLRGARTVDLTSTPSKVAANHLYQQLGFKPRESTTYRMRL